MAQHQPRPRAIGVGRLCKVAPQGEPVGLKLIVHARRGWHQKNLWLVVKPLALTSKQLVPPITRLRQRVRSKTQEGLGRHEILDQGDKLLIKLVEVVDHLRSLVAQEAVVFKLSRSLHSTIVEAQRRANLRVTAIGSLRLQLRQFSRNTSVALGESPPHQYQ